jgi:hypothetical protein
MSLGLALGSWLVAGLVIWLLFGGRSGRRARVAAPVCFCAFVLEALCAFEQSALHASPAALAASGGALLVALLVLPIPWALWPRGEDDDDIGPGGDGPRGPNDDPPPWWPQFERDFARYVERSRPGVPA